MDTKIKTEFLKKWGEYKNAEYIYIIKKMYGTDYEKITISADLIKEQHTCANVVADCYLLAGGYNSDIISITMESAEAFKKIKKLYQKELITFNELQTLVKKQIEKIINSRI